MKRLWSAVRYNAVGVMVAGVFSAIAGCSIEDSIRAIVLLLILFLTGGGGEETTTAPPAQLVLGHDVIDRSNFSENLNFCVDTQAAANVGGTITTLEVFVTANLVSASLTFVVVRDDGVNYVNIGEATVTPADSNTFQTFAVNIPGVQPGDLFGVTMDRPFGFPSLVVEANNSGGNMLCRVGGSTTTTSKTDFSFNLTRIYSIRGTN